MSYSERNIIDTYSSMFNGLSELSKIELIESLTKLLKKKKVKKVEDFYKSFGAFSTEKTAEKIIEEIKSNRKFNDKDISF